MRLDLTQQALDERDVADALLVRRALGVDTRLRALVEFVQPMGATSFAVLRLPDGAALIQDRENLMAAIGPEETFERDTPVWLDIRGDRYCLFDPESGKSLATG